MKASFTNPLALRPPIAHRRKRFLKIAQSQGCTCVKCCTSRHVAIPVARWLERWKQETASSSAFPNPCSVSKKKKKKSLLRSLTPAPRLSHGIWVQTLARFRVVQQRLLSSPPLPGLKAFSRQSDARQAIFTCFPRGSALPLLSSCTCQLCSRHQ